MTEEFQELDELDDKNSDDIEDIDDLDGGGNDDSDPEGDSDSDSGAEPEQISSDESDDEADEADADGGDDDADTEHPVVQHRPLAGIVLDKDLYQDSDSFGKEYDERKRILSPILNKYEKTALIGIRTEQLSNGSKTFLTDKELNGLTDIIAIAIKELTSNKLPFIIRRPIANEVYEYWKLSDLIIV